MIEKLCKNCNNRICKDMHPTMQEKYIKMCLNSNRKMFVLRKEEKENNK